MTSSVWKKRLAVLLNRLYLYPESEPMPRTWLFWAATVLVLLMVLGFSAYFILYLNAKQDAFLTNAEDLGIMDQAIWSIWHGSILHQTICNIVNDTNCYSPAGIMRFAIHFEPILFPVSLLYLIAPSPKTLQIIQTLIVASGAFPAFWLARLRLRNDLMALAFPVLYLMYPALQFALVNDFHAVTFTTALLMFTFYFMYTRQTAWFMAFAILSMACKEEIPVVIFCYALWSMVFQQRYRINLILCAIALAWIGVSLGFTHYFSPTGQALLGSRYASLGHGPVQVAKTILLHPKMILKQHVLEQAHRSYLQGLLAPAAYLPLLAPWVLILALPTLGLNLLSSDTNMYSGYFQYNAEIIPVLVFSTIEACVLIAWLVTMLLRRVSRLKTQEPALSASRTMRLGPSPWIGWVQRCLLALLVILTTVSVVRANATPREVVLPLVNKLVIPKPSAHARLAQRFINMIPADASISAQSALVPHLSQRKNIYMFPYQDTATDYVLLDVIGDKYPYFQNSIYNQAVKDVFSSGKYRVVAAQDGYLLLKRGLSKTTSMTQAEILAPYYPNFCSFVQIAPKEMQARVQRHEAKAVDVEFRGGSEPTGLTLIAYAVVAKSQVRASSPNPRDMVTVTTYWKVTRPTLAPLQIGIFSIGSDGKEHYANQDFPDRYWCPSNTWQAGTIVSMTGRNFSFSADNTPFGLDQIAMTLVPDGLANKIMDVRARLSVHVISGPASVVPTVGTKGLKLATITVVP